MAVEQENTVKFSTILFVILGLIVPLWPISLPFFWYMAYRSYKSGKSTEALAEEMKVSTVADVKQAQELFESGVITEAEFDAVKQRCFGTKVERQP